jgi:hypothetical protein
VRIPEKGRSTLRFSVYEFLHSDALSLLKIARVADSAKRGCFQLGAKARRGREVRRLHWPTITTHLQTISDQLIDASFCALECSSRR